jgi:hypothetical protein
MLIESVRRLRDLLGPATTRRRLFRCRRVHGSPTRGRRRPRERPRRDPGYGRATRSRRGHTSRRSPSTPLSSLLYNPLLTKNDQDDLPPGIDEPSLPALPDFSPHPHPTRFRSPSLPRPAPPPLEHGPPSFDASEAAQAAGGVAVSAVREPGAGGIGVGEVVGDAPPGYFGGISPAGERQGGPPAYS